jgi:branched-chain amino acid transport system permease protein
VIDDRASSDDLQTVAADLETVERPKTPGRSRWWVLAGVMVILLVLPLMRSVIGPYNYTMTLASLIFMWIAMSSSWNILGGYAGYISLGQSVFMWPGPCSTTTTSRRFSPPRSAASPR